MLVIDRPRERGKPATMIVECTKVAGECPGNDGSHRRAGAIGGPLLKNAGDARSSTLTNTIPVGTGGVTVEIRGKRIVGVTA